MSTMDEQFQRLLESAENAPEDLAEMIVEAMQTVTAPLLARIGALEQTVASLTAGQPQARSSRP